MEAEPPLSSLELGGDGDEIYAIQEVENCFGVVLDKRDAAHWVTVGDVFHSLQNALPIVQRDDPEVWRKFTEAISSETGVDPSRVRPETELLGGTLVTEWLADMFKGMMRRIFGA